MTLDALFCRPTLEVAPALLGATLHKEEVVLRIVEVEAYLPGDSAAHASKGRTPRNAPMWGPPGHLYVYLCYGLHQMLNLVTEPDGVPAAVLIRGAVVLAGHETVQARRGGRLDCIGPGKVGAALGLDTTWSARPLGEGLSIELNGDPGPIATSPRIGIDYALPADRLAPYRFFLPKALPPRRDRRRRAG